MTRPALAQRHAVSRRAKLAIASGCALVALVAVVALRERPAQATSPITKATIAIDGSMADWAAVLANPLQTTRDGDGSSPAIVVNCALYSTDRDCPQTGGAGNDLQAFAWTFDDDAVYLYIERFATGQLGTGVDFFFVADVNRDGLVRGRLNQPGVPDDVAIHANWQPGSGAVTVKLADYLPANAAVGRPHRLRHDPVREGDPGVRRRLHSCPGNSSALRVCPTCIGAPNADKLHAELKIPWGEFGAGVIEGHAVQLARAQREQRLDRSGGRQHRRAGRQARHVRRARRLAPAGPVGRGARGRFRELRPHRRERRERARLLHGHRDLRAAVRAGPDLPRQAPGELGPGAQDRGVSDLEVESEEEDGFLWHIRYPLVGRPRLRWRWRRRGPRRCWATSP